MSRYRVEKAVRAACDQHRRASDALNAARAAHRRALEACRGQIIADEHGPTAAWRALESAGQALQAAEIEYREAGEAAYQALKAAGMAA